MKKKTLVDDIVMDNQDKKKLASLVHDRPILWDSRLKIFKGADKEKDENWAEVGNEFTPKLLPQKAERMFKRLREIYRKELVLSKRFGDSYQSTELFEAMNFLRPIIRERKTGLYRDFGIPGVDYAFYAGAADNKLPSTSPEKVVTTTTMIEIPIIDPDVKPKLQHKPIKRRSSSSDDGGSSSGSSVKQLCQRQEPASLDLHEKFGNLVAAKLNSLSQRDAADKMNQVYHLLFN